MTKREDMVESLVAALELLTMDADAAARGRIKAVLAALESEPLEAPLAEGYADPDTLADYNAGRIHMVTLFKVQGLSTEMPVTITRKPDA